MRTAIITTVRHNIGDDFVREGILHLLNSIEAGIEVELIHKHAPITAVCGWEAVRSGRMSRMLDPLVRRIASSDRVMEADLLMQSGAPVYWCHPGGPHCSDNEWYGPLVRSRFLADRRGRKFLNIAGGSCQVFHSDGSEVDACPKCKAYIREFYDACDLTILRDELARKMLGKAGRIATVLPCTSIFARDQFRLRPEEGEYIVLNFMERGGHYTFGQEIDGALWRSQFRRIVDAVKKSGRVVIACHDSGEERLARELAPEVDRFIVPDDHLEFMKFYSRAKFGIVNRVHAGFMMASFGKPVTVIGNDSRALMIENLNLPSIYVGDVAEVGIDTLIDFASSRISTYAEEIEEIRASAKTEYQKKMFEVLEA